MLDPSFLHIPITHRALHDIAEMRPENSRAAVRAAVDAGYGIEIDLQLSADGHAMVFHDYDLSRLTHASGPIRQVTCAQAQSIALKHGDGETIPTLRDVLRIVSGTVPLLIELKDQDGGMGPDIGRLEMATARALQGYKGPVAVMSFNPHSVAEMARLRPDLPRGLTTAAFASGELPLSLKTRERLRDIPDFERVGAEFISHQASDLGRDRVAELKAQGTPVLCWTIRSPEQEAEARRIADNVTFEGYLASK